MRRQATLSGNPLNKHSLKPLAACMAAMFGVASLNAWGAPPVTPPVQNQNSPQQGTATPTPSASPILATRPMTSVFPPQPKEFPGIAWGSFLLYPEVTLSATFDDNIYAERPYTANRTNVTEDVIYTLSPSLELKSNWKRHAFNLDLIWAWRIHSARCTCVPAAPGTSTTTRTAPSAAGPLSTPTTVTTS
ncbi:MAG: hypothetical protein B7Z03_03010 [Hydrogenophilales bacterium 32-62-9]|nr:MAG: hypothetical protein B7Z03_03010 [Hydrogenophilales bacterium 32-62-9]